MPNSAPQHTQDTPEATASGDAAPAHPYPGITVRVGEDKAILERAQRQSTPSELLLTAVQLHRRTIKQRLNAAELPHSRFEFMSTIKLARALTKTAEQHTDALGLIDRQAHFEDLIADDAACLDRLRPIFGTALAARLDSIEHARMELETVTGYHPERLDALRAASQRLEHPHARDAQELVAGLIALETAFRNREQVAGKGRAISPIAQIRRATRLLRTSDGDVWTRAFADIERVCLAGISTLSASVADFLRTIADSTPADVHLHLRPGTGPIIQRRLPTLLAVSDPGAEAIP